MDSRWRNSRASLRISKTKSSSVHRRVARRSSRARAARAGRSVWRFAKCSTASRLIAAASCPYPRSSKAPTAFATYRSACRPSSAARASCSRSNWSFGRRNCNGLPKTPRAGAQGDARQGAALVRSANAKVARPKDRRDPGANPSLGSKAFIIADAKDADMAFGITAPGQKRPQNPERVLKSEIQWRTLEEYRAQIRAVVRQGLIDIMLMSASNVEQLAMRERLFENSHITPAARANDATDIWVVRGAEVIFRSRRVRSVPPPSTTSNAARSIAIPPPRTLARTSASTPSPLPTISTAISRRCVPSRNFVRKPNGNRSVTSSKSSTRTSIRASLPRRSMASSTITSSAASPA